MDTTGAVQPYGKRVRAQGRQPRARADRSPDSAKKQDQGVAFVLDLTERKRAEDAFRKVEMQLAHANRVATMGQLSASITHEVNQPITAAITYALAARRWLSARATEFSRGG